MKTLKLTDIINMLAISRRVNAEEFPYHMNGTKAKAMLVDLYNYKRQPKLRMTAKVVQCRANGTFQTKYVSVVLCLTESKVKPRVKTRCDAICIH